MRAGLAHSLVYRPRVLFLDEPTIGLDVTATAVLRRFVADYARQTGATVLLTSHYMADVESLCRRVILIDGGAILYDGALGALAARLAPYKLLKVALADGASRETADSVDWGRFGEVVPGGNGRVGLRVARADVPGATARLLAELPVADLAVEEPPLESVIDQVYRRGLSGIEA
jgi:ABC-2 type transport system ATP-binding protein